MSVQGEGLAGLHKRGLMNPYKDAKDPFEAPEELQTICCPVCSSDNFHAWSTDYGVMRRCRPCGNEWSGGTMGAAKKDHSDPTPPPGIPAPEDDRPVSQFTGAAFRNLSKNWGGDDY